MVLQGCFSKVVRLVVSLIAMAIATPSSAQVYEIQDDGTVWKRGSQPEVVWIKPGGAGEEVAVNDGAVAALPSIAYSSGTNANLPINWDNAVRTIAAKYQLSPALLEALVWQESRWRTNAVSSAGARGLTQLMPGTAHMMGVNPDDPLSNLEGGARYLRIQLNTFNGNLEHALAAYNAGPERVKKAGGIPHIRETQNYVKAIMGRLARHAFAAQ